MGITDLWSDFMAAVSLTELHAEAPAEDDKNEDETKDDGEEEEKGDGEDKEEGGDEAEAEEEEEEEEEEPEDPKPKLEEAQCAPMKHHYDECVARVTAKEEDESHKGPKEDCVEESLRYSMCCS